VTARAQAAAVGFDSIRPHTAAGVNPLGSRTNLGHHSSIRKRHTGTQGIAAARLSAPQWLFFPYTGCGRGPAKPLKISIMQSTFSHPELEGPEERAAIQAEIMRAMQAGAEGRTGPDDAVEAAARYNMPRYLAAWPQSGTAEDTLDLEFSDAAGRMILAPPARGLRAALQTLVDGGGRKVNNN
jgi:hypothetical protein